MKRGYTVLVCWLIHSDSSSFFVGSFTETYCLLQLLVSLVSLLVGRGVSEDGGTRVGAQPIRQEKDPLDVDTLTV